jgi:2-polyprenyl-3-methyl-5-hydroxy-6-metoxy-1,4-benzoquinol methylase
MSTNAKNDENNWWTPAKLIESEMKFRDVDDVNELDTDSDFGSYRKVLLTNDIKATKLELHNDLFPKAKIGLISKRIKTVDPISILDVGCGMGFTTQVIAEQYPNANVLGVDLSQDAIKFASKTHTKAEFKSEAISPERKHLGKFDIIFCFEFYPFTRNTDIEKQSLFIKYFSRQLNEGGEIVIYQKWDNPSSLSAILSDVQNMCLTLNFRIVKIPHPKIFKYIPNLTISELISYILGKIMKKVLVSNLLIITNK